MKLRWSHQKDEKNDEEKVGVQHSRDHRQKETSVVLSLKFPAAEKSHELLESCLELQ